MITLLNDRKCFEDQKTFILMNSVKFLHTEAHWKSCYARSCCCSQLTQRNGRNSSYCHEICNSISKPKTPEGHKYRQKSITVLSFSIFHSNFRKNFGFEKKFSISVDVTMHCIL